MRTGVAVVLLTALLLAAARYAAAEGGVEKIVLLPGGRVSGSMQFVVPDEGFAAFNLVGRVEALSVVSSGEGVPLYNLTGGTLTVLAQPGDTVNVTYTSVINTTGPVSLTIKAWNQSLELYLHADYVLLGVEPPPDDVGRSGDFVVLRYVRLSSDLSVSFAEIPSGQAPQGAGTPVPQRQGWAELLLPLLAVAAVVVAALVYLSRRRGGSEFLSEDEKAILDYVRSRGGRAYVKEIREALGLPSTTALRRVKRLEERGKVKTVRTPEGLLVVVS